MSILKRIQGNNNSNGGSAPPSTSGINPPTSTNLVAQGTIDLPFVKHNKEVMETVNDLWRRAEGKL